VDNVIDMLTDRGCDPTKIHACFGPSICPQCYEVDPSLAQQFIDAGFVDSVIYSHTIDPLTGNVFAQRKPHLDLVKVNINRLIAKGIPATNINPHSPCTRHHRSATPSAILSHCNTTTPYVSSNPLSPNCDTQSTHSTEHSSPSNKNTFINSLKSSFTSSEAFTFHSWRRDPGTPSRLITAITLHPSPNDL
ncbi:MAG: polyphenol oxidase family protein, partial [Muribaculaceae bacterium]|nr:polyphenol oxidase family protein [Muribaculaceae bacterium]